MTYSCLDEQLRKDMKVWERFTYSAEALESIGAPDECLALLHTEPVKEYRAIPIGENL